MNVVTVLESFIISSRGLLILEKEAEDEEFRVLLESRTLAELCDAGVALCKMHVTSERTGLGGRKLIRFSKKKEENSPPLPNHKLSPGDIIDVAYSSMHRDLLTSGVLSGVSETAVTVSCDQWSEEAMDSENRTYCLIQAVNDVTHRRMMKSLENLENYETLSGINLVEYAFGKQLLPYYSDEEFTVQFFDDSLNIPQQEAVRMACHSSRPISIIHGPPGTGKTRTVVEVVRQCVHRNEKNPCLVLFVFRVLLCAPSNVGVDNVIERLKDSVKLVRLGHPARTHPDVQKYTLDGILANCDQTEIISDIRRELDDLKRRKGKFSDKRKDLNELRKELSSREKSAVKHILKAADVVCATLTSADPESQLKVVSERGFDVVVIDECAQGLEVACWLALIQGKRCVLAGDHCQLPPTILSEKAASAGLSRTLMARIQEEFPENLEEILRVLTVQYRMNERIMKWASSEMYQDQLLAAEAVKAHTLREIAEGDSEEMSEVLWLIDTDGCEMPELVTQDEESKGNPGEVLLAFVHVSRLISAGISQEDIAVISPYNLQVQLLRNHLKVVYPKLAVRSVDGFQGQEREALVLSLVRSNTRGEVGFLKDRRRINVAVTRARRHLCVICDSSTVKSDPFITSLVDYIQKEGSVRSALEYKNAVRDVPFSIDCSDLKETAVQQFNRKSDKVEASSIKEKKTVRRSEQAETEKQLGVEIQKEISTFGKTKLRLPEPEHQWRIELAQRIDDFICSEDTRLELSCVLASYQRRFVHETAEQRHISHFSIGDGEERRIVLQKKSTEVPSPESPEECAGIHKIQIGTTETSAVPKTTKTRSKKEKGNKGSKPNEWPEDEDALLEQFAKEESRCKFEKCKKGVSVLGMRCKFCAKTFCISHSTPEVHGCGDAAKQDARRQVKRELSGITLPPKRTSDETRRTHLQKKMEDKRKEIQNKRKPKQNSK